MMRYHWIYHLHRHHTTTLLSPDFNPRVSLSIGSPGDPPVRILRRQLLCCKWTMDSYLLHLLGLFVYEIKMTISLVWLIFEISDCGSHRYGNDQIIGAIWDINTDATPLIDHATENQRLHLRGGNQVSECSCLSCQSLLHSIFMQGFYQVGFARSLMYKSPLAICYQDFSRFSIFLLSIYLYVSRSLLSRTQIASSPESIAIYVHLRSIQGHKFSSQPQSISRVSNIWLASLNEQIALIDFCAGFQFGNRKDPRPMERQEQVKVLACYSFLCMWAMHHSFSALTPQLCLLSYATIVRCKQEYHSSYRVLCATIVWPTISLWQSKGSSYILSSVNRKQETRIVFTVRALIVHCG